MDYAAATPIDERVLRVTSTVNKKFYANPSGLHKEGQEARRVFEEARSVVAQSVGAHADEIVFTSGATEANNMAIQGAVRAARARGVARPHVIVSAIEHASVLETTRILAGEEVRVDLLPVDHKGIVDVRELRKIIVHETVLVSVMYANNEIGTVQPLREIAKEVRHARKMHASLYPYLHTDAAQASNYLDTNILRLGVDLMTLSSGKSYGPRGIGALFVKRGVNLVSLSYGGEHERARRPGTEVVALACGFAEALVLAEKIKAKESLRIKKLRDALAEKILKKISGVAINGDLTHSLPNLLSISIEGVESDAMIIYLDAQGFAVSGGSACKSASGKMSHVLKAIGYTNENNVGAIRFSLGRLTKSEDITRLVKEFPSIVNVLRDARKNSDF